MLDRFPRARFWVTVAGGAMVGAANGIDPIPFVVMVIGLTVVAYGMFHLGYETAATEVEG